MAEIESTTKEEIGRRVAELREALKFKTQKGFADAMACEAHTIRDIESGKQFPTIPLIRTLVENYYVSPAWLLVGHGPKFSTASELQMAGSRPVSFREGVTFREGAQVQMDRETWLSMTPEQMAAMCHGSIPPTSRTLTPVVRDATGGAGNSGLGG